MGWLWLPKECRPPEPSPSARAWGASTSASTSPSKWPGVVSPRVMWRSTPMRLRSWRTAWKKVPWLRALSGTTYEPSTANRGVVKWISSLEDILVSHSLRQAQCWDRKTRGTSGPTSPGSSEKSGPRSASSRMLVDICYWALNKSTMNFVEWATRLRRACLRRGKSVRRILAAGSSSWPWPTPNETDYKASSRPGQRRGQLSEAAEILWPTPDAAMVVDTEDPESWLVRVNKRREEKKVRYGTPLAVAARLWPTLVTQGRLVRRSYYTPHSQETSTGGEKSSESVRNSPRLWPTILSSDANGKNRPRETFTKEQLNEGGRNNLVTEAIKVNAEIQNEKGGPKRLNPRFAEWLLGWLPGWTDFVVLEMEFVLYKRLMRSSASELRSAYLKAVKKASMGKLIPTREF